MRTSSGWLRRLGPAVLVAAVALLAILLLARDGERPATAQAAPVAQATAKGPVLKAIWGPVDLPDGRSAFPIYAELGVDVFQVQLGWAATAPSGRPADATDPDDPAYRWPALVDTAVREAGRRDIEVAIMVRGAPGWANGGRDQQWAPEDPGDLADFLTAASRRYPQVRRWMIWGEPTRDGNFQPMPAGKPKGPRRYAQLLDAAYGAIKAVDRRDLVIGGMTWTVGLVMPADFVRWMRLPNGQPPRLDLYGHNPFSTRFPKLGQGPYVKGLRDLSDIDTLHRELARAYPRRTPDLWLSEFTVSSDRPSRAFSFAVSRKQQARWVTAAYRLVNGTGYVDGLGWFTLHDEDPSVPKSLTNGLITFDGKRKPAFAAYRNAP